MKDALGNDSPSECYVVEIDGVPKFEFRGVCESSIRSFAAQTRPSPLHRKTAGADESTSVPEH